jgi:hypothetical protein
MEWMSLRRMFGHETEGVVGGWRKTQSEDLTSWYSWQSIRVIKLKEDELGGSCSSDRNNEKFVHITSEMEGKVRG